MSGYNGKPKKELEGMLAATEEKLRVFRFAMTGGKQKNVKEGGALRKDISRIKTALSLAR